MASRPKNQPDDSAPRRPPATTPEARENQMIAMTFDLVEKRLLEGSASATETTHFLKLGSSREQLEQERLRLENSLTEAKREALIAGSRLETLFEDAMRQFKGYKSRAIGGDDEY